MLELRSVSLIQDATVFGKHGKQLSNTMQDISIAWDGKKVIVTSIHFPGKEEWVLPALIGKMTFVDPAKEER